MSSYGSSGLSAYLRDRKHFFPDMLMQSFYLDY